MGKPKGSTAAGKQDRIQTVIDLIVKYGCTNAQIKEALQTQEPQLSTKTIQRTITEARMTIRGMGSQSSDEERGLLCGRVEDLYACEKRKKEPNPHLLNQVLRTQLSIHQTHPHLKKGGNPSNDPKPTTSPALSSELENALARLSPLEPNAKPKNIPPSP